MIQAGFLLLLCIAAVTAGAPAPQPPALPPCVGKFKAATNFDIKKLAGKWYQVRRIASVPERQGTCEAAKYTVNTDGSLKVDLGWVDTKNAKQKISGTIKPIGGNPTNAQLMVTIGMKVTLYIIFHFADSFFGVYACTNDHGHVWVFANTKEVDDNALDPIKKAMSDNGLDKESLKLSAQAGCPDVFA